MLQRSKAVSVSRGINFGMVLRVLGQFTLVESIFMSLPLLLCLYNGDADWKAFLISLSLAAAAGGACVGLVPTKSRKLSRRDGLLLASVAWVVFSVFGMLPFVLCGTPLNVSEAFFEAMSGLWIMSFLMLAGRLEIMTIIALFVPSFWR